MEDWVAAPAASPGRGVVSNASRKGDESRQRILEAALIEFGKAGFRSATTRSISERASMTLPQLGYYFGGKEGLYRSCAEEIVARYARVTHDAVEEARRTLDAAAGPEAARETLKKLMTASIELILGNEAYALGNGIVARELAEPGPAFDIFYDRLWLPGIERNSRLISRIKSEPDVSEESRLQSILLVSSIPSLHTRRVVAQRAMAWTGIGPAELALVSKVLHKQIDQL
ncbi:CerR family C-terminal domain-containing protein [Sphingopyxis sp. R3-92]|uniref:CerR family C-terminal domain-containing protein n=1 Tax=Sphingopyxis sp. R3-92 TaxID=3158553 RepID=UPI003EE58579